MKKYVVFLCCFLIAGSLKAQVKLSTTATSAQAAPFTIAFRVAATFLSGEPLANNTEGKVNFTGAYFDEQKNFSIITDEFTIPADGIYHFDLRVSWLKFSAPASITLKLRENLYTGVGYTSVQPASVTMPNFDSNVSALLKLKAGDKISVHLLQNSGVQQKYQQVILSGFKVN